MSPRSKWTHDDVISHEPHREFELDRMESCTVTLPASEVLPPNPILVRTSIIFCVECFHVFEVSSTSMYVVLADSSVEVVHKYMRRYHFFGHTPVCVRRMIQA